MKGAIKSIMAVRVRESSDCGKLLPNIEKCCCFDLKTGTILIGALNLSGSVILAIYAAFILFSYAAFSSEINQAIQDNHGSDAADASLVINITFGIILVLSIFYIGIASLLIHGARTGRPGLLMPWMVLTGISLLFNCISIFSAFLSLEISKIVSGVLGLALGVYFFLCVKSLRNHLWWENKEARLEMMAE